MITQPRRQTLDTELESYQIERNVAIAAMGLSSLEWLIKLREHAVAKLHRINRWRRDWSYVVVFICKTRLRLPALQILITAYVYTYTSIHAYIQHTNTHTRTHTRTHTYAPTDYRALTSEWFSALLRPVLDFFFSYSRCLSTPGRKSKDGIYMYIYTQTVCT